MREVALAFFARHGVRPDEVAVLEDALRSKRSDVRRGVLAVLMNRPDDEVRASVERLSAAKDGNQRRAASELAGARRPDVPRGLGLVDDARRTPVVEPIPRRTVIPREAGAELRAAIAAAVGDDGIRSSIE